MKLNNLNEHETEVVRKCLECVASGRVILHDFEFQSIMGVEVDEFLKIYKSWPDVDEKVEDVHMAINNSMNNLLGYPHGRHHRWSEFMAIPLQQISEVFQKWRGDDVDSYLHGIE